MPKTSVPLTPEVLATLTDVMSFTTNVWSTLILESTDAQVEAILAQMIDRMQPEPGFVAKAHQSILIAREKDPEIPIVLSLINSIVLDAFLRARIFRYRRAEAEAGAKTEMAAPMREKARSLLENATKDPGMVIQDVVGQLELTPTDVAAVYACLKEATPENVITGLLERAALNATLGSTLSYRRKETSDGPGQES